MGVKEPGCKGGAKGGFIWLLVDQELVVVLGLEEEGQVGSQVGHSVVDLGRVDSCVCMGAYEGGVNGVRGGPGDVHFD